ncbi:MAG: hypothetical protein M3Q48_14065 [Actinomycetota bacterium]|nr:hypothetical protein [Actinomycetota bacterium]
MTRAVAANPLLVGVLGVYTVAVAVLVTRHEPWFDEAQAWLLARDTAPLTLVTDALRYEGSPGLWHLTLTLPAKLGLPYVTLNVISAGLGVVATFLFVRYSPFPAVVKALFPFTFFVFYQYTVVARSYAFFAPLLFLLAHVFPRKTERVYAFTALLCLVANVSVHGLLIAGSVMALHLWDLFRSRAALDRAALRRQATAVAAFALVCALVVLQLLPPDDLTFAPDTRFTLAHTRFTLETMVKGSLTERLSISAVVLAASGWWFWRARCLALYLLPTFAILAFSSLRYWNLWHQGTLFLVWVFVLWVSFATHQPRVRSDVWARRAALVAIMVVILVQVAWSAWSARFDYLNPYSGSRELARYIERYRLQESELYATGYPSVAVLPYFDHNIFANHKGRSKRSFWFWSTRNAVVEDPAKILAARPDFVVLSVKVPGQERATDSFSGYRVARIFPGDLWWKNRVMERDAYILLQRT